MDKIRVGIIGVGNCFSGLWQGIEYYRKNTKNKAIGLMHAKIGRYGIDALEFTAAFDVDTNKIGKSLNKACYTKPNLVKWVPLPRSSIIVQEAPVFDGIGYYLQNHIPIKKNRNPAILRKRIIQYLKKTRTEIIINYLPVGSERATKFWADIALVSKCAFINCIPIFIASDQEWVKKFAKANLPLVGDDIKGQVGATIVHRVLTKLCADRGVIIDNSYQLNIGGNTDFLNMKEAGRLISKRISKTKAVISQLRAKENINDFYIGPSDYVPFLGNTKLAFIRIVGRMFADIPFYIDLKLEVNDKANSAGVVIDAVRLTKLAMEKNIGGYMDFSSYFMKHPLMQKSDDEAARIVEKFIAFCAGKK